LDIPGTTESLPEEASSRLHLLLALLGMRQCCKVLPVGRSMLVEKHQVQIHPSKLLGYQLLHIGVHVEKEKLCGTFVAEGGRNLLPHHHPLVAPCSKAV